ncbi:Small ribosomal subunit biogenesis GTPase RsgA [Rubrivivax sp. A210]|uniref:ribosome small subunit-dependent GTPase A n=1 Tax=Rubrivivax sp. A210 TaxID=2772301 RepID=UPI0019196BD9|nr:ribosome small subunit-dependent GTPase A [Rubrivivax sp. A210]CAD5372985.1 Small ribosomal subunit biogenesis GTPase RsgA [Rubrivivax sp. A210]
MNESPDFPRLARIGLTPAVIQNLAALPPAVHALALMRVTEVQREGLTLHDGLQEHGARLLPALRARLALQADAVAVGDWVLAERNALAEWWVAERVPPLNQLARRLHDGRDKVERLVIVSNVDTALLVMGLDHDFNPRRLERYIALVAMAGIDAVVVLTKQDLCADTVGRLRQARAVLPAAVPALALNALGDEPRAALAPWLGEGRSLVLMGSSGAGKSTLTNALIGADVAVVGANRADDSRGRHTTTARSLHLTADGACIIDTPGLRTLRLDGEAGALDAVFADIGALALRCRFRDCRHEAEPGCAVREAVADERLRNYHKLQREALRDTQSALERKTQVAQWKVRTRSARERSDAKRGRGS